METHSMNPKAATPCLEQGLYSLNSSISTGLNILQQPIFKVTDFIRDHIGFAAVVVLLLATDNHRNSLRRMAPA